MFELWKDEGPESEVPRIAKRIAESLLDSANAENNRAKKNFCLWLEGPMGAGKTTTTRAILYELGLPRKTPVLSPTYTYMTEYQLPDGNWFAHLDLYRLGNLSGLEEAGFDDRKCYQGIFVEWPPDAETSHLGILTPSHKLSIATAESDDNRIYNFFLCR